MFASRRVEMCLSPRECQLSQLFAVWTLLTLAGMQVEAFHSPALQLIHHQHQCQTGQQRFERTANQAYTYGTRLWVATNPIPSGVHNQGNNDDGDNNHDNDGDWVVSNQVELLEAATQSDPYGLEVGVGEDDDDDEDDWIPDRVRVQQQRQYGREIHYEPADEP